MDIDVLGGLAVLENGVPVVPAAPPARQVLAVLAGYADQTVPVAVLAEELEAYAPPEHTRAVLHSCVRQLRGRLAAAVDQGGARSAATMLVQTPGGYLLDTGGGRCDLWEFSREAGAGYRAMARGDYEAAARRLRGALGLWRGPAFDGVDHGPRLAELIAGLEATRKSVMEQWVEAELALGRRREAAFDPVGGAPLRSGAAPVRSGEGDTGWGRRHAPAAAVRPFPASGAETDFHRSEAAVPSETYRLRHSVLPGRSGAAASAAPVASTAGSEGAAGGLVPAFAVPVASVADTAPVAAAAGAEGAEGGLVSAFAVPDAAAGRGETAGADTAPVAGEAGSEGAEGGPASAFVVPVASAAGSEMAAGGPAPVFAVPGAAAARGETAAADMAPVAGEAEPDEVRDSRGYAAARAGAVAAARGVDAEAAGVDAVRTRAVGAGWWRSGVASSDVVAAADGADVEAAGADGVRTRAVAPAGGVRAEAAGADAVRTRAVRAGAWLDDGGRAEAARRARIGVPPGEGTAEGAAARTGDPRYGDVVTVDFGTRSAVRRTARRRPLSPSVA
ncbi:BTAD domain-containing putative transcriptional regulator [Streptomyces sp. NPDC058662]|uniref:BTAD domain-containing putative transcriptional regulator n=1 Tax=Streptomyces sp. NPDC058662 TaxID=3346583 RepID=UPI00366154F0